MKTVAVIDYGAGNLTSVKRGLRRAGLAPTIAGAPAALLSAHAIFVPGVGHFSATRSIGDDWRAAILDRVRAGVPILGICLGMQWLFDGSTEAPGIPGLGLAQDLCRSLIEIGSQFSELTPDLNRPVKVPHLGWNTVVPTTRPSRVLAGIEPGAFAYFAHSFAAPIGPDAAAITCHGSTFASVIERDNIFGAQFHPELSGRVGARLFDNFARLL
jgi:glutamine amidotransferase